MNVLCVSPKTRNVRVRPGTEGPPSQPVRVRSHQRKLPTMSEEKLTRSEEIAPKKPKVSKEEPAPPPAATVVDLRTPKKKLSKNAEGKQKVEWLKTEDKDKAVTATGPLLVSPKPKLLSYDTMNELAKAAVDSTASPQFTRHIKRLLRSNYTREQIGAHHHIPHVHALLDAARSTHVPST